MLKIRVRQDRCCGAALCVLYAPEVYSLDAQGYNDRDGQTVPADCEDAARSGAAACPESAIELLETALGGE